MTDLNKVIIMGRITHDLGEKDFTYIGNNNTARAVLSVAVNRSKKVGENWENEVNYFDVTIWGKTAENLKPYLVKGKQLLVEGYLKQDRWEKDGEKKSKIGIVADNVFLMGGKAGENSNDPEKVAAAVHQVAQAFKGEVVSGDFTEDIPF